MNYTIEWAEDKDIVELITELAQLLERGCTHIRIETEIIGDGNNADGSDEYENIEAKLVSGD